MTLSRRRKTEAQTERDQRVRELLEAAVRFRGARRGNGRVRHELTF